MKRIYLALLVALLIGTGLGVSLRSADAQSSIPMVPLAQSGGPLIAVGAASSGTGNATVAWVLEPGSKTIWACINAPAPSCTKTRLP
jgi:hypothetical protein